MNLPSDTMALAPALLGCILRMETPEGAMEESSPRLRPTPGTIRQPTFGGYPENAVHVPAPFFAYVYRSYGLHHG